MILKMHKRCWYSLEGSKFPIIETFSRKETGFFAVKDTSLNFFNNYPMQLFKGGFNSEN